LQDGGDYTASHAGYETAKISGNDFVFEPRECAFTLNTALAATVLFQ